jgi:uncharacterized protein YegP (UPF0339 family)
MRTDTVEIYKGRRGLSRRAQWRWRFLRSNGKKLADSAESYANVADLLGSLATVLGVPREDVAVTYGTARGDSALVTRPNGASVHVVILR